MVLSKIDKSVDYMETRYVEKDDLSKQSFMYKLVIENKRIPRINVVISIGKIKKIKDYDVYYFPIYLITKDRKSIKIGVYEVLHRDEIFKIIDKQYEETEEIPEIINTGYLDSPLLWSWVNSDFLKEKSLSPSVIESDEESEDEPSDEELEDEPIQEKEVILEIPSYREDIFTLQKDVFIPPLLKEETKIDAEKLREENDLNWVSNFMKNKSYNILTINGKDSFFTAIKLAFSSIGQNTSEDKLRSKLSESSFIESYFSKKKINYNEIKANLKEIKKEKEKETINKNEIKTKHEEARKTNNRSVATRLSDEYKIIKEKLKELEDSEKEIKKLMKQNEYVDKIQTLEEMKKYITTNQYEAELYTLYIIEKILKVKFIIFLSDSYKENDIKSILDCGEKDDFTLGDFIPEYYIFIDYSESEKIFSLISYKNKSIFKIHEIPFDLKQMIKDKCKEEISGNFGKIPEFRPFHEVEVTDIDEIDMDGGFHRKKDGCVIVIYCPSSKNKFPGQIRGESMPEELKLKYIKLSSIENWRCILDNNWTGKDVNDKGILKTYQFMLDNYYWNSVQHYVQANKFKEENNTFYETFALGKVGEETKMYNSSDLSQEIDLAIFMGTKPSGTKFQGTDTGKFKDVVRKNNIQIDINYNKENKTKHLTEALKAKFLQNPLFKKILINTNDCILMYGGNRKKNKLAKELMNVRDMIR